MGFNRDLLQNLCQNNQIDQIRRFVVKNNNALFKYDVKDLNTDFKMKDFKFYKKNGKIILSKNYYKSKVDKQNNNDILIANMKDELEKYKNIVAIHDQNIQKLIVAISEKLPEVLNDIDQRFINLENKFIYGKA